MPVGKVIPVAPGEYPQLDGVKPGSPVKFEGEATLEDQGNGQMGLRITSIELETEGAADREFKSMTQGDQADSGGEAPSEGAGEDF